MTEIEQIQAIDQLIKNQYAFKNYGELQALSKLFDTKFLNDLETILNVNSRIQKSYKDRFEISCGWIDKIPLAQFTNPILDINGNSIKGKMELGDLLLIYTHNRVNIKSKETKFYSAENRATIVQAKIADKALPEVPIGKMPTRYVSSTSKELALLSSWPEFDLYQTSRSKLPILTKIQLDSTKPNAKFAGYFSKNWYVGKPVYKDICNDSFGSLIVGMIKGNEGQEFDVTKTSNWDKLIETLVSICGKYQLPNFVFGGSKGSRFINIPRRPLIFYFYFFYFFTTARRFPIIVINRIVEEG